VSQNTISRFVFLYGSVRLLVFEVRFLAKRVRLF